MGATNANIITGIVVAATTTTASAVVVVIVRLCFVRIHTHTLEGKKKHIIFTYNTYFSFCPMHLKHTAGYN